MDGCTAQQRLLQRQSSAWAPARVHVCSLGDGTYGTADASAVLHYEEWVHLDEVGNKYLHMGTHPALSWSKCPDANGNSSLLKPMSLGVKKSIISHLCFVRAWQFWNFHRFGLLFSAFHRKVHVLLQKKLSVSAPSPLHESKTSQNTLASQKEHSHFTWRGLKYGKIKLAIPDCHSWQTELGSGHGSFSRALARCRAVSGIPCPCFEALCFKDRTPEKASSFQFVTPHVNDSHYPYIFSF